MSIDPFWEEYYSLTPYQYCNNNPLILIDKTGYRFDFSFTDYYYRATAKIYVNLVIDYLLKGDNAAKEFAQKLIKLRDDPDVTVYLKVLDPKKYGYRGSYFDIPNEFTPLIQWGPLSAECQPSTGETLSPAMGLVEELGHFLQWLENRNQFYKDSRETQDAGAWEKMEEKRCAEQVVNPVATSLNEGTKSNHQGTIVPVTSPIERPEVQKK